MAQTNVSTSLAVAQNTATNAASNIGTNPPANQPGDNKTATNEVELPKNVGHLMQEPVEVYCPACRQHCLTRVETQIVTAWQILQGIFNCCCCCCSGRWKGRFDYNHYCGECGCFIGRYMTMGWYKRRMIREQRLSVEWNMAYKEVEQKVRDHVVERLNEKNEAEKKPYAETTTPISGQK